MKRVHENDDGVTKNSAVFKKGRFLNGVHGSDGALEGTQGEEERDFTGTAGMVTVEMDKRRGSLGNEVSGDFGSSSPGGLKQADQSDFGHDEQREYIDLNVPVFQGFTEEELMIDQRRIEVIDIVSDDSDDEVEIVGFSGGTGAKETLNHGSVKNLIDYFVGGSGPVTGGERNYAGEGEGMSIIDNSWLSLNNLDPNDVEVMARQSEALPAIPDRNELELRHEEEAIRQREEAARYREVASKFFEEAERAHRKRIARPSQSAESSGKWTSGQGNNPHHLNHAEGLGSSPGPLADAVELFRETVSKIASHYAVKWKPSLENLDRRIHARLVPSLLDLTVLQLDLCGQIMIDLAFRDMPSRPSNKFSSLSIISLRGAFRLSDSGLKEMVLAAPYLLSINLGQCSLLTCDGINSIAALLRSNLRELYINECTKISAMQILPAFRKFGCLEVLSVREIQGVTDQFISELINSCGKSIKELDLADCQELTDYSLEIIGSKCVDLRSLNISNLHNLTDLGMEHLANGCKSMQKLKLRCNRFSDEVISSFLESCGGSLTELQLNYLKKVGPNTALALAKCSRKLLSLDLSWCRGITDECVGLIVDSCSSLKLLKLFGCKQITSVFLYGHSNPVVQIVGPNSIPLLKNLDLLEPEQSLLRYSSPNLTKSF